MNCPFSNLYDYVGDQCEYLHSAKNKNKKLYLTELAAGSAATLMEVDG